MAKEGPKRFETTCLISLAEKFPALSEAAKKEVVKEARKIRDGAQYASGMKDLVSPQARIEKALQDWQMNKVLERTVKERNAWLSQKAVSDALEDLRRNWNLTEPGRQKNDVAEGLKAILGESLADRPGAKNGVAKQQAALENQTSSAFTNELQKNNLHETAFAIDEDTRSKLFKAVHALNRRVPDEAAVQGFPKEIIEAARTIIKHNKAAVAAYNKAGGFIGELDGFVASRAWSALDVATGGGQFKAGSQAARDFFIQEHMSGKFKLDLARSFPNTPIEKIPEILGSLFDQFSNGYHLQFEGSGNIGGGSLAKKHSHDRVLHYENADAEYASVKTFAPKNASVGEMVHSGITQLARDTAVMQRLGPNPKNTFQKIVDETLTTLHSQGRSEEVAIVKSQAEKLQKNLLPALLGELSMPADKALARAVGSIRGAISAGMTAGSTVAQIADVLPFMMTQMKNGSLRGSGREIVEGFKALAEGFFKSSKRYEGEMADIMSEFGVGIHSLAPHSILSQAEDMSGLVAWLADKTYKWNRMTSMGDAIRTASASQTLARGAAMAKFAYEDIPSDGFKRLLRNFGLHEERWNALRELPTRTTKEGFSLLDISAIKDLPDATIERIAKAEGLTSSPKLIEKLKTELSESYRNMVHDSAVLASTDPTKIDRAIMLQGTKPGTAEGEALRSFFALRSFVMTHMRRHLGGNLHGFNPDRLSTPQALLRLLSPDGQSSRAALARTVAWGIPVGMAVMTARDLRDGKKPQVLRMLDDPKEVVPTILTAGSNSGSLSIISDFFTGEAQNRFGQSPLVTALGPMAGVAEDASKIVMNARANNFAKIIRGQSPFEKAGDQGAELVKFGMRYTPGVSSVANNLFTRWAFSTLVTHQIQEMTNPGYLRRSEERLKKEKGTEYLPGLAPSDIVKRGGGFK